MDIFPNWTVIPVVFSLLILAFALNRVFFQPLQKALAERSRRIEGAQHEAEEIRKSSENRLAEFDHIMRQGRRESDQLMAKIRNEALNQRQQIVSEKRSEAEQFLKKAKSEIQARVEEARQKLVSQSREFARRIAAQILKRSVQESTEKLS
jgi:F-type H+-transporting ATPase subunit b